MFKTLNDVDVKGRRVIVRADLNLPMRDGRVLDMTRIQRVVPTLLELSEKGACIVIIAHFGRPKGRVVESLSLRPVVSVLSKELGDHPIIFVDSCLGDSAKHAACSLRPGEILLLENLRFQPEEEANDANFSSELAKLGEVYVNDAFSAAHRAHASTEGITHFLPAFAGRGMEAELLALQEVLDFPARPVLAIIGGAKVSTKLTVLGNLLSRVQNLVIGGAMANTFLLAEGRQVGDSLVEPTMVEEAKSILKRAKSGGCIIHLPKDAIVASNHALESQVQEVDIDKVPSGSRILDIGPETILQLQILMTRCPTLVWNGPLGLFEEEPFQRGTVAVAQRAGELTLKGRLKTVAGGGDTVAALRLAGVVDQFSYVSSAGGAFLEWMEGKSLPGILALD